MHMVSLLERTQTRNGYSSIEKWNRQVLVIFSLPRSHFCR